MRFRYSNRIHALLSIRSPVITRVRVRRGGDDEGGKTTLGNQRVDCVGACMESPVMGCAVYKK